MAHAKANIVKVEKIIEVEKYDGVTLNLTQLEADFLRSLLENHIVGCDQKTPRGLLSGVFDALKDLTEDKGKLTHDVRLLNMKPWAAFD